MIQNAPDGSPYVLRWRKLNHSRGPHPTVFFYADEQAKFAFPQSYQLYMVVLVVDYLEPVRRTLPDARPVGSRVAPGPKGRVRD